MLSTQTAKISANISQEVNPTAIDFDEDTNIDIENEIFVFVSSYSFKDDVTSFTIRSKYDPYFTQKSNTRDFTNFYFAYGWNGYNGVKVTYISESCEEEYISAKLQKRNCSTCSWSTMGLGNILSPGGSWSKSQMISWYQYKLRVNVKDTCPTSMAYSIEWLT